MKRLFLFLLTAGCLLGQSMNVTVQPNGAGTGTFNNPQINYYLAPTGQTWDFRNATVYLPNGGGGGGGIQSVTGTTNQINAITTANAVTLSTPQDIATFSNVQFGGLGIGIAPTSSTPVNFTQTATASGSAKAIRVAPTLVSTATGDTLDTIVYGGNINTAGNTGLIYNGLYLNGPGVSGGGSITSSYLLYMTSAPSTGSTATYGIYQYGTDLNYFNGNIQTPAIGVGVTPSSTIPFNFTPTVTASGGSGKAFRVVPNYVASANGDTLDTFLDGGNINTGTFTNLTYNGLYLNGPGVTGSGTIGTSALLYMTSAPTTGSTSTYGIYQYGTDLNYFNGNIQTPAIGMGVAPSTTIPFNFTPTVTSSGGTSKGFRIAPTLTAAANGNTLDSFLNGGTINTNGYTSLIYNGLYLNGPSVTGGGSLSTSALIYMTSAPTATAQYGIFQLGTDVNQLNNLKLTPGGGGGITFADGTVQTTAGGGGGGGTVTSVSGTGSVNGIILSGTVTTSGSLTLGGSLSGVSLTSQVSGTLPIANGGTGVTTSSGANSVVLRDSNSNVFGNNFFKNFLNQAASGTTITLTVSSSPDMVITGSGGQVIKLPDATTLPNGNIFTFNNNQSSGTITVQNNSGTTIATLQSGSFIDVVLLSNATSAGSWDYHNVAPSNASWSTNTLSWAGTYSGGTWNGNAIGAAYGGTGTTGLTGYVYGNGTSAMTASTTIPTSALSGTISNSQLTNSSITVTAGSGLSGGGTVALGGSTTLTNTGVTSLVAGSNITINSSTGSVQINSTNSGGTVTSVSGTGSVNGITLSGTVTSSGSLTLGGTLSGISNSQLTNSSISIAGTATALGGSISQDTITGLSTTGLVKRTGANTLAIATSGTDYAPATSGTSLLYGNGSGGFSNASVGSSLTFSAGTLNTIQGITTTSNPQFGSLGVGVAASGTSGDLYVNSSLEVGTSYTAGVGVNFNPPVTSSAGVAKGIRLNSTLTAAANSDTLDTLVSGGTIATGTYTGLVYNGLYLNGPNLTGTGSLSTSALLYMTSAPTATSHYGIYQLGTDPNYFSGAFQMTTAAKAATNQNLTPATTTVSSTAIDWSQGNSFYKAIAANTTFTFSNAVDGQVITICILQSGGNFTVTWPTMKWSGGTAPTMTATNGKYDVYTIYYNATVGAYFGSYVQNF